MKRAGIIILLIFLIAVSCEVFKNETGKSVFSSSGADIAVTSMLSSSSVTKGELLTITVSVENIGEEDVNSDFNILLIDQREDIRIGTSAVESGLAAGDTTEVIYEWDTGEVPAGEYTLQATHDIRDENPSNDTTSTLVTVNESSEIDIAVTQITAPPSATTGDVLEIEVTVENIGNRPIEDDVSVPLENQTEGFTIENKIIEGIQEGASANLTYIWDTSDASPGDHQLQVTHNYEDENPENDVAAAIITLSEPQEDDIAITEIDAPASAMRGDEIDINVTVENNGNRAVDEDINVTLENQTESTTIQTQTINGLQEDASTILTYSWNTGEASPGEHQLQVAHSFNDDNEDNNSASFEIDITEQEENEQQENDIAISSIDAPSSIVQGEQIDIEVTIENSGDQTVVEEISVSLEDLTDDNMLDTRSISGLETGEDVTLSFTWETSVASVGNHDLQASLAVDDANNENNTATVPITIEEPLAPLELSSINPDRMQVNATIEITISGSGFESDVSVSFEDGRGPDPEVSNIAVPDANTITATVTTRRGGPPDDRIWDLRVINPDNSSAVLENAFTVNAGDNDDDDEEDDDDDDDD